MKEPHVHAYLGVVCSRGAHLLAPTDVEVRVGKVTAIVGASGSGKSALLAKLVSSYTPMIHTGKVLSQIQDYSAAMQPEEVFEQERTVEQHLDYLSDLGSFSKESALHLFNKFG